MNRRRQKGRSFYSGNEQIPRKGDTLSDRAVTTGLLYNYLQEITPEDVDGLKRAQIKVRDTKVEAKPLNPDQAIDNQMYGLKPTLVTKSKEPTSLITRYSPKDSRFPELERYNSKLLRSALRKIVDEV